MPIADELARYLVEQVGIDPMTPANLYAGTHAGVFKSTDGGGSWSPSSGGMDDLVVWSVAVDAFRPNLVYAWSAVGPIRSTDGGGAWTRLDLDEGENYAAHVAVDPKTTGTAYATRRKGMYKSTDRGESWTWVGQQSCTLVIDPQAPTTMYAAGGEVGKSTDGGLTWETISDFGDGSGHITTLAIDPNTPSTLYAGHSRNSALWKTTDAGATWKYAHLSEGGYNSSWQIALDPTTPGTVYASLAGSSRTWKSTDGGKSWTRTPLRRSAQVLFVHPRTGMVLASVMNPDEWLVYASADRGQSWTVADRGWDEKQVHMFAGSAAAPNRIYAATGGGVYRGIQVP